MKIYVFFNNTVDALTDIADLLDYIVLDGAIAITVQQDNLPSCWISNGIHWDTLFFTEIPEWVKILISLLDLPINLP